MTRAHQVASLDVTVFSEWNWIYIAGKGALTDRVAHVARNLGFVWLFETSQWCADKANVTYQATIEALQQNL